MAQWKETLEPYVKVIESVKSTSLNPTAGEDLIIGTVIVSDSGPAEPTLITSQKDYVKTFCSEDSITEDYIKRLDSYYGDGKDNTASTMFLNGYRLAGSTQMLVCRASKTSGMYFAKALDPNDNGEYLLKDTDILKRVGSFMLTVDNDGDGWAIAVTDVGVIGNRVSDSGPEYDYFVDSLPELVEKLNETNKFFSPDYTFMDIDGNIITDIENKNIAQVLFNVVYLGQDFLDTSYTPSNWGGCDGHMNTLGENARASEDGLAYLIPTTIVTNPETGAVTCSLVNLNSEKMSGFIAPENYATNIYNSNSNLKVRVRRFNHNAVQSITTTSPSESPYRIISSILDLYTTSGNQDHLHYDFYEVAVIDPTISEDWMLFNIGEIPGRGDMTVAELNQQLGMIHLNLPEDMSELDLGYYGYDNEAKVLGALADDEVLGADEDNLGGPSVKAAIPPTTNGYDTGIEAGPLNFAESSYEVEVGKTITISVVEPSGNMLYSVESADSSKISIVQRNAECEVTGLAVGEANVAVNNSTDSSTIVRVRIIVVEGTPEVVDPDDNNGEDSGNGEDTSGSTPGQNTAPSGPTTNPDGTITDGEIPDGTGSIVPDTSGDTSGDTSSDTSGSGSGSGSSSDDSAKDPVPGDFMYDTLTVYTNKSKTNELDGILIDQIGLPHRYYSTNAAIATVDGTSGRVTGKKVGSTTIKLVFDKSDYYAYTVKKYNVVVEELPIPTITLKDIDPEEPVILEIGDDLVIEAETDMPEVTSFTYSSGNSSVLSVSKSGVVTALKSTGTSFIAITVTTADSNNYKTVSKSFLVKVVDNSEDVDIEDEESTDDTDKTVELTEIKFISGYDADLTVGNSRILLQSVSGSLGKRTFESSNPEVLSVSDRGIIKGISEGTATVTVKVEGTKGFASASATSNEIRVVAKVEEEEESDDDNTIKTEILVDLSVNAETGLLHVDEGDLRLAFDKLEENEMYIVEGITDLGNTSPSFQNYLANLAINSNYFYPISTVNSTNYMTIASRAKRITADSNKTYMLAPWDYDDGTTGFMFACSPSVIYWEGVSKNRSNNNEFAAVFGPNNGVVNVVNLAKEFTKKERQLLLQTPAGDHINTIFHDLYENSYYINDNYTNQTAKNVLSEECNSRFQIRISKAMPALLNQFKGEQNNVRTRKAVTDVINYWFSTVVLSYNYSISDYKVTCDETNNDEEAQRANRLYVRIQVRFQSSIKYITVYNDAYAIGLDFE